MALAGLGYYFFGNSSAQAKVKGAADRAQGKAAGAMDHAQGNAQGLLNQAEGKVRLWTFYRFMSVRRARCGRLPQLVLQLVY